MIVLDIETTGLNPKKHSVIEVAAIEFDNPQNVFNEICRKWPGAEIDQKALDINGFSPEEITNPAILSQKELLMRFNDWLNATGDRTIAGHNIAFDISFLNESCKRFNLSYDYGKRTVDQHSLVYSHFLKRKIKPPLKDGVSNLNSDFIMSYVGIPAEPKPHRAINGARFEMEALSRLIHGSGIFDEFSAYPLPDFLKSN